MSSRILGILFCLVVVGYVTGHVATRVVPELRQLSERPDGRAFADFDCYVEAAREANRGASIYGVLVPSSRCVFADLPPYIYPPALAVVLRPVAARDHCQLERLWLVLNVLGLLALIPLLMHALRLRGRVWWCTTGLLVVAPMATLENLTLGQINVQLLVLALLAWTMAESRRPGWGIALVAWAASLKVIPALWIAEVLRRGGWRAATGSAAVTVALAALTFVFVPDDPLTMVHTLTDRSTGSATTNDASLVAAFERAFGWSPRVILALNSMAVLTVLAWFALRARARASTPVFLALTLTVSLACLPLLEAHHLVLMIPAHLVLAHAAWQRPGALARARGLAVVVLAFVLLNSRGLALDGVAAAPVARLLAKPAWLGIWIELVWLIRLVRRLVRSEDWSTGPATP